MPQISNEIFSPPIIEHREWERMRGEEREILSIYNPGWISRFRISNQITRKSIDWNQTIPDIICVLSAIYRLWPKIIIIIIKEILQKR